MHVLDPSHGVGRLITYEVLVVISGRIGFSLKIALKVNLVRCPKFDIYQVTRASIVPIYRLTGTFLQNHFGIIPFISENQEKSWKHRFLTYF